MSKVKKYFSVDAKTILTLGRDSIKNHTTALIELVKNSYDADATVVEIEIDKDFIRIADNGCGMSEEEVEKNWLRIGYSEKKDKKISAKNRRKTGEKGVGRLSSDRLGGKLTLSSRAKNNEPVMIKADWNNFNVAGKELTEIPLEFFQIDKVNIPFSKNNTGTEIIIKTLRQEWSLSDIEDIYDELSAFSSPFSSKKSDFKIFFTNHLSADLNGLIKSPFYETAEIMLTATLNDKKGEVIYSIDDRTKNQKNKTKNVVIKWDNLSQSIIDPLKKSQGRKKLNCGPVQLNLLFFSQKSNDLLKDKGINLKKLSNFLNKNSGIKIYRDNISVKPYGYASEEYSDWLRLADRKARDPAGLARPTYKVSAHQIVGTVDVGRDSNPQLRDSTPREGFVRNESYFDLRAFTLACVQLLERYRHEDYLYSQKSDKKKQQSPRQEVEDFSKNLNEFKQSLTEIKSIIEKSEDKEEAIIAFEKVEDFINEEVPKAKKSIEELLDYNRVLGGLASIGIAAAVFGHETQSSIAEFKVSANTSYKALTLKKGPNLEFATDELRKSLEYADKVAAWGEYALVRVRKEKRTKRKTDIDQIINKIVNDIQPVFDSVGITLKSEIDSIDVKLFPMDIETILINLLTNAYTACLQHKNSRAVSIKLKSKDNKGVKGFMLSVSDSGPGVDESMKNSIWEPLVTTKQDKSGKEIGTGLGLTIIKSIVQDMNGDKNIDNDPSLKGARFNIWLPTGL